MLAKKEIETEKKSNSKEDKEKIIAALKERAEKLAKEKIEDGSKKGDDKKQTIEELKEKIEDSSKKKDLEGKKPKKKEIKRLSEKELKKVMTDTKETLVPLTDYIRSGTHLGTKVITPDMRKYVYKRRADGLAVVNTLLIDEKLREAIAFLNDFEPKDIFLACKREACWPAAEKFSEVTGIKVFTKKYPAGIITNIQLENFFEAKLVIICDPWVDKNALNDSLKLKLPIIGICDTNNYTKGISQIVVSNNKSRKSVGLILYVLAKEYLKNKGMKKESKDLKLEDFTGKLEEMESK